MLYFLTILFLIYVLKQQSLQTVSRSCLTAVGNLAPLLLSVMPPRTHRFLKHLIWGQIAFWGLVKAGVSSLGY